MEAGIAACAASVKVDIVSMRAFESERARVIFEPLVEGVKGLCVKMDVSEWRVARPALPVCVRTREDVFACLDGGVRPSARAMGRAFREEARPVFPGGRVSCHDAYGLGCAAVGHPASLERESSCVPKLSAHRAFGVLSAPIGVSVGL